MRAVKQAIKAAMRRAGYEIVPVDLPSQLLRRRYALEDIAIYERVRPYTLVSGPAVLTLLEVVDYIHRNGIAGDIVECGVWRGGCSMAVAYKLKALHDTHRVLHLFDTFEGMVEPTVEHDGLSSYDEWKELQAETNNQWCRVALEEVADNLRSVGYNPERLRLRKGLVEDTVPAFAPEEIALLRLDTDYYASTKHELVHLYPRLARGGILIIDDYFAYPGAQKATNEFIRENDLRLFLHRIESGTGGAIGVKL